MLDLNSPIWGTIAASPGRDGRLTAQLLGQLNQILVVGNHDHATVVWEELHQQICHQHTVGETAYVALPHLTAIAGRAPSHLRALLLSTIGVVVASRQCHSHSAAPLRREWAPEFDAACTNARRLAAHSLQEALDPADALALVGTVAALHGLANLTLLLEGGPEPCCPSCGQAIVFGENPAQSNDEAQ